MQQAGHTVYTESQRRCHRDPPPLHTRDTHVTVEKKHL